MIRPIASLAVAAAIALSVVAGGTASAQMYGNGYGSSAPGGSYQKSCQRFRANGQTLTAMCRNDNGQYVRTSINYTICSGSDIANVNGQLSCARVGTGYYGRGRGSRGMGHYGGAYSGAVPSGSYLKSCNNASMNGSTLTASCRNDGGYYMQTYLDASRCSNGDDISNVNGQLRCAYNRRY